MLQKRSTQSACTWVLWTNVEISIETLNYSGLWLGRWFVILYFICSMYGRFKHCHNICADFAVSSTFHKTLYSKDYYYYAVSITYT